MNNVYIGSNYTAREAFNLYGTVRPDQMEDLLDKADALETVSDAVCHIQDGTPDAREDHMAGVLAELRELFKHVRGDNADRVRNIIEAVEELQTQEHAAIDHCRDELRKAADIVEGLIP